MSMRVFCRLLMGAFLGGTLMTGGCTSGKPSPTPTPTPTPRPTPTPVASTQPADVPKDVPDAGAKDGTVRVTAIFKGERPRRGIIRMGADANCEKANAGNPVGAEGLLVNANGTIQNVIFYVSSDLSDKKFETPTAKSTLNQVGCMYTPHVQTVMTGQAITVINSDPTLHNVHSLPKKQREFNFAQPNPGDRRDVSFARPEFVKIKCDVHPWMSAFIGVFDHPYHTVTDRQGVATLDMPVGACEIRAWHEELGDADPQKVDVKAGETVNLTFEFSKKD